MEDSYRMVRSKARYVTPHPPSLCIFKAAICTSFGPSFSASQACQNLASVATCCQIRWRRGAHVNQLLTLFII